jgi:hypothetical protein
MCYGPVCKIILGILLVIAGLFAIVPLDIKIAGISSGFAWDAFKTLLLGGIPPFIALIGLLLIWIELEELKIEMAEKKRKKKK